MWRKKGKVKRGFRRKRISKQVKVTNHGADEEKLGGYRRDQTEVGGETVWWQGKKV